MANVTLTPAVAEILARSTITANSLTLPGQLDRKTYELVAKAIEAVGGKWNRKAKCHVFSGDPRDKLGLALQTGVVIDEKKQFQAFYTPPDLAERLVAMADVNNQLVLEPSAGNGALADACMAAGASKVDCIELNPECRDVLADKGHRVLLGDFLSMTLRTYPRIVMNPPFTRDQDLAHVEHALRFLEPGGILVAVMSPNTSRRRFEALIEGLDFNIERVPAGAFKQAGTSIATLILVVRSAPLSTPKQCDSSRTLELALGLNV